MNDGHGSFAQALRWWRAPFWVLAILTGAKSFWDNPVLGSARLRGRLHLWRKRTAHALAERRRARIAPAVPADLRAAFDRDGFVMVPDFLPPADFARLQADLLDSRFDAREHQQGDTITRRIAVTPVQLRRFPALDALIADPRWTAIMNYVGATRAAPLYYIQTIVGGVYASLRRRGKPIPTNDMWIAATALQHGLAVFTYDPHFQSVEGITVGSRIADFLF